MSKKISIEVGHGGRDPGAVRGSILEKEINLTVALELDKILRQHGVQTLMSRTTDVDDPAREFYPKAVAFKPDVGIAIHTNAFNGTARGFEVFRNTNSFRSASNSLCAMIEAEVRALGQSSRGIKDSNFLMSNMQCPTAFLELGFLDNPIDFSGFDTPEKQRNFASAYARGVLRFLGIQWLSQRGYTVKDWFYNRKYQTGQEMVISPTLYTYSMRVILKMERS
jgi:N-acetylmuramoyl-L-alanine amidase